MKELESIVEGLLEHLERYNYKNSPSEDTIRYYNREYNNYKEKNESKI